MTYSVKLIIKSVVATLLFATDAVANTAEPETSTSAASGIAVTSVKLSQNEPEVLQTETVVEEVTTVTTTYSDGTSETRTLAADEIVDSNGNIVVVESSDMLTDSSRKSLSKRYSHFVWGSEIGICADLSGMDMSSFNFDLFAGYRNAFIQTLALGAGVHKSLGNRDSFIPIYVLFRSSFRKKPSLCFLNLRIGYSFNTISNSPTVGDTSCAIGCGFNLSRSKKIQSYILVAYAFRHFNQRHTQIINVAKSNVSLAQVSFGITL